MKRLVNCCLVVALLGCVSLDARAQSGESWLVLPATTAPGQAAPLSSATAEIEKALRARSQRVWDAQRAAQRFEQRGSAPAPALTQAEIDAWQSRSQNAVKQLVRGELKAARIDLLEADRFAAGSIAAMTRSSSRARQVLDNCLYSVRALVETARRAEAKEHAKECRRMLPGVEPTEYRHTPAVEAIVATVDKELTREGRGVLSVDSKVPDCRVRLNGVLRGRTPLEIKNLAPGNYQVQVECVPKKRGRVRHVLVTGGRTALSVDPAFDDALTSRPSLALAYKSDTDAASRRTHAPRLVRTIGGGKVMVASVSKPGELRVDAIEGRTVLASAWMPLGATGPRTADVATAVDALLDGRSMDFTGPKPKARATGFAKVAAKDTSPQPKTQEVRKPKQAQPVQSFSGARKGVGYALLGVGGAGIAVGWALHAIRGKRGDDFVADPPDIGLQGSWLDLRPPVIIAGAAGAVLGSVGAVVALPPKAKTPWWAWVSGGVGVGLAAYGIVQGITAESKPSGSCATNNAAARACVDNGQQVDRAILLGSTATPLITIPLVYLLRRSPAQVAFQTTPGGMFGAVSGTF